MVSKVIQIFRLVNLLGEVDAQLFLKMWLQNFDVVLHKLEHVVAHRAVVNLSHSSVGEAEGLPFLDSGMDHHGARDDAGVAIHSKHVGCDIGAHGTTDRVCALSGLTNVFVIDVMDRLASVAHCHHVVNLRRLQHRA